jgi:carboxymethylenebutenolidase
LSTAPTGGHRATPTGTPRGAVVVVHEIFGLTPHIRSVCDRLAAEGYLAHAPDLFAEPLQGGFLPYTPEGKARGLAIKNAAGETALAARLSVCADALRDTAGARLRVGVVGFCLGGALAWLAAERGTIDAAVGYYGVGIGRMLAHRPACPVLMHFGRTDPAIPAAEVAALRAAHPTLAVHEYDAGHAFNRDDDASYEPASAAAAWRRTLDFLSDCLEAR